MAYRQTISRDHKALFVFLLDQSRSMDNPTADGKRRTIDALTAELNAWLADLVISCSRAEGIKDFFDIAVLGYSTDEHGTPIIGPAWTGPLAGRDIVTISEIADCPARIDTVTASMRDEDTGVLADLPQATPIWVDPVARGEAPMCAALVKTCEFLDAWIARHPASFPPIVINMTGGGASEGDPLPYADAVRQRATDDGHVLLLNCHLSSLAGVSSLFPGDGAALPDGPARMLFAMSSVLPDSWRACPCSTGSRDPLEPNPRGFSCNASMRGGIMNALSWCCGAVQPLR